MISREDNYYEIKTLFLTCYLSSCAQKFGPSGHAAKWSKNEHESARAYEDTYDPKKSPIEQLMLEVIDIVLHAGRGSRKFYIHTNGLVGDLLKKYNLDSFLATLPEEELIDFKADLYLCGLYMPDNNNNEKEKIHTLINTPLLRPTERKLPELSFIIRDILSEGGLYAEISIWFLDCYYFYCRNKMLSGIPWNIGEREIYYAYNQLSAALLSPFEQLILEIIFLVLDAGRSSPRCEELHRNRIRGLLPKDDFSSMAINTLPSIGAWKFGCDLHRLGFLSHKEFKDFNARIPS